MGTFLKYRLSGSMRKSRGHPFPFDYLASNQEFPDELLSRAYRGIILSDYPAINFTSGQLVKLAEKVHQGTGFLMIGDGRHLQERIENTLKRF